MNKITFKTKCLKCGGNQYYKGPEGGGTLTYKCAAEGCDLWYCYDSRRLA